MSKALMPGTRVRGKDSREGLVIADLLDFCGPECVMVHFDGALGFVLTSVADLEFLGQVDIKVDPEKCRECIFFNGGKSGCMRTHYWLPLLSRSKEENKRRPCRIFPFCQEEVSQGAASIL